MTRPILAVKRRMDETQLGSSDSPGKNNGGNVVAESNNEATYLCKRR